MDRYIAMAQVAGKPPQCVARGGHVFTPCTSEANLYATARAASDAAARLAGKFGWSAACWANLAPQGEEAPK